MSRKLDLERISTQEELFEIAEEAGSVFGGATVDPYDTARELEQNGFRGTMYYAHTTKMKLAEDKLLAIGDFRHNKFQRSGVQNESGYIYVIQGQKRNNVDI